MSVVTIRAARGVFQSFYYENVVFSLLMLFLVFLNISYSDEITAVWLDKESKKNTSATNQFHSLF